VQAIDIEVDARPLFMSGSKTDARKEKPLIEAGPNKGADNRRWRGHFAEHSSVRARLARQCGRYSSIVALS
jgi:hypothetical protein